MANEPDPIDIDDDEEEQDEEQPDFWALLDAPPRGCADVADLFHWSTNYDPGSGPATLFLDLIGWSDDNIGCPLYDLSNATGTLGYVELHKLADALVEYTDAPQEVRRYVDALTEAEGRG